MSRGKDARNARIVAMREAGETDTDIAAAFGICTRTAREVYLRTCDDRMTARTRISTLSFDALVDAWNHLTPSQRRERAAECRAKGHTYTKEPVSTRDDPVIVCRRCLNYVHPERKAVA